jgi:hypothetical protein
MVAIPRRGAIPTLSMFPLAPPAAPTPLVRAAASAEPASSAVAKPVGADPPVHASADKDDGGDAYYSPGPEIFDSMCTVLGAFKFIIVLHHHSCVSSV